jgi:hypothetical protein
MSTDKQVSEVFQNSQIDGAKVRKEILTYPHDIH